MTHAEAEARKERDAGRARDAAELTERRAQLSEEQVLQALGTTPSFDPYLNDNWGMRQQVLDLLQLGVRTALLRNRAGRRAKAVRAALAKANVSLGDKKGVRALVLERARSAGGAAPAGG